MFRSVRIWPFVVISTSLLRSPNASSRPSKFFIMNGSPIEQLISDEAFSKNGPYSPSVSRLNGASTSSFSSAFAKSQSQ